ncbi:2,3-bisphosphoglycerate-independent phosphoglycerate mutase [Candidatus Roizmanbacteria bacterium CG_4_8_14_3_um_filter_36_10]|uniref:2,3-bisphosphoglycerate-independent phosphoglycerate mutase n=1 Tax=Candidatus Roizmanbacteria bacterium CG_4_8_14_3_um_filter_36_10 TaxID=1974834 RepID=A0A2M8GLE9_9BACT|nr:MAG: 2,3-bisphosphoglycerate-independent phosphoglycerate mutase [Candidatus Roizmanbacteria bacterium CG_4_8_14_3_um_filter_36_10]
MNSVILIILDGFGLAPPGPGNAIYLANPHFYNSLIADFPNNSLQASGEAVGLPQGDVGNTEVGHLNLGAGRVVYQDLPRINMSIADGSFYKKKAFLDCLNHVKKNHSNLHIIGLVSNAIVHSSIDHLWALLHLCHEHKIERVSIHAITDGRDSAPESAIPIIKMLEEKIDNLTNVKIVTIMGRYYAMDRDTHWERTAKAYFCLTKGIGEQASSAIEAVEESYKENITYEFILPTNIVKNRQTPVLIEPKDGVIFFNYRIDRPRQLTKAFVLDDFENTANKNISYDPYETKYSQTHLASKAINTHLPFHRGKKINDIFFSTMTEYDINLPVHVAFLPIVVDNPLGKVLEEKKINQLHMAETEKERFVTFYFNGQREPPFINEERIIIPSPPVVTYDLQPEMSAYEITKELIKQMRSAKFSFIVVNFANPDMVGHTGNIEATIKAIKAIDHCLEEIIMEALNLNINVLITGDHGNAEQKINPQTGGISTEHTANLVPFIFVNQKFQQKKIKISTGILGDVAPTVLALLNIKKPDQMTGRNLLEEMNTS